MSMEEALTEFQASYTPQPPRKFPEHPNQILPVAVGEDNLSPAPREDARFGNPPVNPPPPFGENTYLWVITGEGIPHILENDPRKDSHGLERLTHTNLTGGGPAYRGGEIWFKSETGFWLSGHSGRYMPQSEAQLLGVIAICNAGGYHVLSLGWDEERNLPIRWRNDLV
jgi:hypothetical protein